MKKNKIKILLLFSIISILLSGCGNKEEKKAITRKQEITELVTQLTKNPNVDAIQNSKIVSPDTLINAFNVNFDLALNTYNKEILAIPVNISQIQSGKLVFNEQTVIDGNYAFFTEQIIDKKNNSKEDNSEKTNLVCSIKEDDNYLLEYGKSQGIEEETGLEIPPLVSQYYLVGSIYSVVGNDKYNILIKDARLFPATTYMALQPKENIEKNNVILDVASGENINEKVNQYFWTDTDFDLDGFCDELTLQTNEYNPESSFDKLVYNKIYNKIKTPLKSVVQLLYKEKNLSFNFNFPLKISNVSLINSSSFDGSFLNIFKFDLTGNDKKIINYIENEDMLKETFEEFNTNAFFMENQSALCQANKTGINVFTIKLLDGRETQSINSDIVFLKDINIDNIGNITGDIYIKAQYPFEYYYKSQLRIMSDKIIMEVPLDNYIFYDAKNFELYGEFKNSLEVKNYSFLSNIDIPVCTEKQRFSQFEITSNNNGYDLGYGLVNIDGIEKKVNIFKTLGQKFAIIDITKDEKEDFYWIYIANDKLKGYIPVTLDNELTFKNTNINILTKLSDTSYTLNDLFDLTK